MSVPTNDIGYIPLLILLILVGAGIMLCGLAIKRGEHEDKKDNK